VIGLYELSTKTGRHDIAEILLKVALSTINQIKSILVTLRYGLREMISGYVIFEDINIYVYGFLTSYVVVFSVFSDLWSEVIVRFVDIGEIVDHHYLNLV
jgi:hypothetical protein